jgi:hypothetical protein
MTSDNGGPDRPARITSAELYDRIEHREEHLDEQYHALIRRQAEAVTKLDAVLARQAELLEMIRPYMPLLERISSLADGPAGKLAGGPLAALLARHGKTKGTAPDAR